MKRRGIDRLDFVYVCGDAYVDHPSFGHAIITRLLESYGYSVGIIAQPDWKTMRLFLFWENRVLAFGFRWQYGLYGQPLFGIQKERRQTGCLFSGRCHGKRPDYASIVYCNPDPPDLQAHTDHHRWDRRQSAPSQHIMTTGSNKVKRSILMDSGADLISSMHGRNVRSLRSQRHLPPASTLRISPISAGQSFGH